MGRALVEWAQLGAQHDLMKTQSNYGKSKKFKVSLEVGFVVEDGNRLWNSTSKVHMLKAWENETGKQINIFGTEEASVMNLIRI